MHRVLYDSLSALFFYGWVNDHRLLVLDHICCMVLSQNGQHDSKLLPVFLLGPFGWRLELREHLLVVDRVHLVEGQQGATLVITRVLDHLQVNLLLVDVLGLGLFNNVRPDARLVHVVGVQAWVAHLCDDLDEARIVVLANLISLEGRVLRIS